MKRVAILFASVVLVILAFTLAISVAVWAVPAECTPPPKNRIEILKEETQMCAEQCKAAGSSLKSFDDTTAFGDGKCECQSCGAPP